MSSVAKRTLPIYTVEVCDDTNPGLSLRLRWRKRIEFRTDENPFAGRRNELTPRQVRKRQRLVRRVKGGKR